MGKVRPEKVKRIAHEFIKRHPGKFGPDFEENKKIVMSLSNIPSSKLRNRIVGYITRLMTLSQQS